MKKVKKILCMLTVVVMMILMMTAVAFATDSSPGDMEIPQNYMTWEFLGTMSGAVAATTLFVQFLKVPIDKVWKIPTRFIVYVIALLILLAAEYVTQGGILFNRAALIVVNAILVSMAAMGAYEVTFRKLENWVQT
jgi:uncharacterized membrane protein